VKIEKIPVLSVRQPFAWALIFAGKPVENRTWYLRYRGPLFIHAGRAWHACGPEGLEEWMRIPVPRKLDRGGIVGMVEVTDCVSSHPSLWFEGPWGIVCERPLPLPFIPCPGALGLFKVPERLRERVAAEVQQARRRREVVLSGQGVRHG